ncbi:MAG: PD-(D/E)XK nuclease domain-containing protein, partial [Clostridiales bacterium]|nr:PD-(D/E)XK nuclease domain-containing protein [Clostridiales bacterium]
DRDMEGFLDVYQEIVLSCTSYFDAKENAYHMLFLGMCISLAGLYKITSNIEAGHGRSDIRMESLHPERPHIVIEFKQGEDVDRLKEEALTQIVENQYCAGLEGECLCVGIAHNKKRCVAAHRTV